MFVEGGKTDELSLLGLIVWLETKDPNEQYNFNDCNGYLSFAGIASRSGLDPKVVRRTVRALARKGLAEYGKGLWTDDGELAGSGYCATERGIEIGAAHDR